MKIHSLTSTGKSGKIYYRKQVVVGKIYYRNSGRE
jgi:hypothetical protein